jgi:uncharacterized protein (DUF305 family)
MRVMALFALIAVVLVAAVQPARAEAPAPDPQTARYEVRFLEGMIDHHAMAVMMAEMCLHHAVHPELLAMCENIMTTQSQEIAVMQSWLQDWYGMAYEPQMPPGHHQSMHQRVMRMSPQEFEIWFMRTMIRHHEGAIREAEVCLDRADHPELLSLCQNIIVTQRAEIQQMQAWLCDWYGLCRLH